tara:strand:+ start:1462 stop:2340 length:879 start_codon:yes stop_codon:yes gene_type:complete
MKKIIGILLAGLLTIQVTAQNKRVTEGIDIQIKKSALSSVDGFTIKNINGDLKVSGYDGDEILITGSKTIRKKRGELDQRTIDEIYLRQEEHEGIIYVYVQAPGVEVSFKEGKMRHSMNWNRNRWEDYDEVHFEFNIEVKMPESMMVKASTVNGGKLIVENMLNGVDAGNVNGDVVLKEVDGKTHAHTVNGDIEVYFAKSPTDDSRFNTVNGSMEIYSPKDLGAVVTFESLHGDLYTDFEKVTRLKSELNKERDGKGYRYRIGKTTPIQIGEGGAKMEFETINGSAYIRKRN